MTYLAFLRNYMRKHAGRLDAYVRAEVETRLFLAAIHAEEKAKKDLKVALALAKTDETIGGVCHVDR